MSDLPEIRSPQAIAESVVSEIDRVNEASYGAATSWARTAALDLIAAAIRRERISGGRKFATGDTVSLTPEGVQSYPPAANQVGIVRKYNRSGAVVVKWKSRKQDQSWNEEFLQLAKARP